MSKQPLPEAIAPAVAGDAKVLDDIRVVERVRDSGVDVKGSDGLAKLGLDEALLASVDTDREPVVTRRELWSYYSAFTSFARTAHSVLTGFLLVHQCITMATTYFYFVTNMHSILESRADTTSCSTGSRSQRIQHDPLPVSSHLRWLGPRQRSRLVMFSTRRIRALCSSLGWRDQGRIKRSFARKWHNVRGKSPLVSALSGMSLRVPYTLARRS